MTPLSPMRIDPRILGQRLQEARKARGLTQQDAAEVLAVSRPTYIAIEKGERAAQPAELTRLAEFYGRTVNDLLRQREPIRDFVPHFRAAASRVASGGPELEQSVARLQRLCDDYLELETLCNSPLTGRIPEPYLVKGRDHADAAEEIAAAERNRLGLGDGPVRHLRDLLETDVGLRVFYLDLPSAVAGLFFFAEGLGGCIAVQSKHPPGRQLWSLAHEYAHFLVHRYEAEVTVLRSDVRASPRERLADSFARCFLMPAIGLRRRFHDLQQTTGPVTPTTVITLADQYGVSFEAMLLRLEGLRLVPSGTWRSLKERGFRVKEAQELLGLSASSQAPRLPQRYQNLAVQAYRQGLLSEGQLVRLLHTDRVEARRIAQESSQREEVTEDGELGSLLLDLAEPLTVSRRSE